jgi:light-regulated signal transduction histidine kinase (bacteriophytochrome)
MACEFLGRLASLQIGAFEDQDQLAQRASRRSIEERLAGRMRESAVDVGVLEALLTQSDELMGIVSAEGVAVVRDGEVISRGRTPSPALIQDIATWAETNEGFRTFATASLGIACPPARAASDVASGLLTFALPGASQRRLLWFRPEVIQTVSWGGDPSKPVAAAGGDRLRPRHSFAMWHEEVRLRAWPWTASNLEAADELQRRAIEVDLERRVSSEQRAVRDRDELLAVVSHDLQNPLASILLEAKSMLRLTSAVGDNERVSVLRECAEAIEESATRMISLTNELLDLASIDSHRVQLHLQLVESRKLVEDAVASASNAAKANGITLALELIDSPTVKVDPDRMFRVLSNLLGNAVKFTPDGGTITIRAALQGDDLSIAIIDTGPGIPDDHLPHVFERYWKGASMTTPGSGLGLYIARGIVEAHEGKIWAESSKAGARFTFTLPVAR